VALFYNEANSRSADAWIVSGEKPRSALQFAIYTSLDLSRGRDGCYD